MALLGLSGSIISEAILVLLIAVVLYIVFKLGKFILKIIFGIIANSVLGVVSIFVLNYFFNIGIPIKTYTLIASALFGLPAVGTMIIMKFFGVIL